MTARQVLCHSTGFADWRSSSSGLIQAEPGTTFQYSGEGYYYLQSVITQLTGKTDSTQCATYEGDFEVCATDFDDFMTRNLLRPFGMNLSGYVAAPQWEGRIAHGHDPAGKPILKRSPRGSDVARYGAVGGLHTNAREYAKFLSEVVAGRRPDAWRLAEKTKKEMIRPHIKIPKGGEIDGCSAWALGWGVQERGQGDLLVHSGGQTGFRSLALASVEGKSGFVIFTNGENGGNLINDPEILQAARALVLGEGG